MTTGTFFFGRDRYYDRKKKTYSRLSGGCAIVVTTGKKRYSRLSGRCAIVITNVKKKFQSSVWRVRGSGDYNRRKKVPVVCLVGCAVVLCQFLVLAGNRQFFCCGGKFLLRPEKKIQSSVWRVRDHY